jgi:hypothetical protein
LLLRSKNDSLLQISVWTRAERAREIVSSSTILSCRRGDEVEDLRREEEAGRDDRIVAEPDIRAMARRAAAGHHLPADDDLDVGLRGGSRRSISQPPSWCRRHDRTACGAFHAVRKEVEETSQLSKGRVTPDPSSAGAKTAPTAYAAVGLVTRSTCGPWPRRPLARGCGP